MSSVPPSPLQGCETLGGLLWSSLAPRFWSSTGLTSHHRGMLQPSPQDEYLPTALGHLPSSTLSPTAALQLPGMALGL